MRDAAEIKSAITKFARDPGGTRSSAPTPFTNAQRNLIMALMEQYRLLYGFHQFVTEGALISYAPDAIEIVRRSAVLTDTAARGRLKG